MKEFLSFVVRQLVNDPSEISLKEEKDESGKCRDFLLLLPSPEIGKIIGKQGHTIRAIRTLLDNAGDRHGERVRFEVAEQPEANF